MNITHLFKLTQVVILKEVTLKVSTIRAHLPVDEIVYLTEVGS